MTKDEIKYLEGVTERAKERRKTWFGPRKTSKAEAAEMVLIAYAPAMLAEIKGLRPAALDFLLEQTDERAAKLADALGWKKKS